MVENKKIGLSGLLFLAMGTFSTMPVLEVSAAGRSVTFFSLTFFAALVFLWVRNKNFLRTPILTKPLRYFVLWMVTGIVAGCAGWLYFNGDSVWQSAATSYLPKLVLYIAFAILWEQGASEKDGRLVLKGLLLGAVLNCVWAVLDGLCYYVAHFSLNNVIFSTYIERHDIRLGQLSLILGNGLLRAAGFNTDPANIGFLGPVVVAYGLHKRRYGLTLIGLLSLVFSASTTAVVVTMVIFVLEWKNLIPKRKRPRKGMQTWMYLVILLSIAVAAAAAVRLMPLVIRAVGLFVERFNGAYLQSDVTSPRTVYYLGFFKALLTAGVIAFTGSGFGTSSFPYIENTELFQELEPYIDKAPFDPEMTYIAYLFDCGILGLVLYVYCLFLLYRYYKKNLHTLGHAVEAYYILLATVFSALFYHYILFSPQVLLIVVGLAEIGHSCTRGKLLSEVRSG